MNDEIRRLREETSAGVMDCKRAFEEAKGDYTKALQFIRERGFEKAEKKASRVTGAGLLSAYIHNDRIGVLLEVRCETDFVARTDGFKNLVHALTLHIAATGVASPELLLQEPYIRDESMTVADLVKNTIAQVGENIQIARFARYEL